VGGEICHTCPDQSQGPTWPPGQWVPGLLSWGNKSGHGIAPPPLPSAEVKERVELYLYSPAEPSWPGIG